MISRGKLSWIIVRIKGVKVGTFYNKREKSGRIPLLAYLSSSIWASPAQTLVKTVNVDIPLGYSREYLQRLKVNQQCKSTGEKGLSPARVETKLLSLGMAG